MTHEREKTNGELQTELVSTQAALSQARGMIRELIATDNWKNCGIGTEKRERFERVRRLAKLLYGERA